MEIITIIFIIIFLIGLAIAYWFGSKAGSSKRDQYWEGELPSYRKDAIMKSRAVLGGQFSEQLAPYLPNFEYLPTECRFIGKPIDFIVFKGMDDKKIEEVIFIEVKSGKAQLNQHEKNLKDAIDKKRVKWIEYRIPEELTKKEGVEFDDEGLIDNKIKEKKENNSYQERMDKIHQKYKNAYNPWEKEEERELLHLFNGGKTTSEIAEILKRQPSSINARLKKLGKIE